MFARISSYFQIWMPRAILSQTFQSSDWLEKSNDDNYKIEKKLKQRMSGIILEHIAEASQYWEQTRLTVKLPLE